MAQGIYDVFKEDLMLGNVNLVTDAIRVALFTSAWNAGAGFVAGDTIFTVTDEVTGTLYVTRGELIDVGGSKTVAVATNTATWDSDDTPWGPGATISGIRFAQIFDPTNADVADSTIATIDFGSDQSVSSGTFTIVWNVLGIITLAG